MPWPVWDYSIRIYDVGNMRNKDLKKTGQIMSRGIILCGIILKWDHLLSWRQMNISLWQPDQVLCHCSTFLKLILKTCFRGWNSSESGASPLIWWISHIFYYVNQQMLMSLWTVINLQVGRTVACQLLKAQNSVLLDNLWRPLKASHNKNMQEVWWPFSSFTSR